MELKEAIEILNWNQSQMRLGNLPDYSQNVYQSIETVLQELDRLQKENEELKEIDLTTVHIKGVCDEKERWRNKIREKIEEIIENEEGYAMELQAKIDILNHLLKEE